MAKEFYSDLRLGILGGGQLGRMLIQEAISLNVDVHILDPDKNAPCKDLCTVFEVGALNDFDTVYQFGKKVDMLTIEIEKVNVDALEQLENEGVLVYPTSPSHSIDSGQRTAKAIFQRKRYSNHPFSPHSEQKSINGKQYAFPLYSKTEKRRL